MNIDEPATTTPDTPGFGVSDALRYAAEAISLVASVRALTSNISISPETLGRRALAAVHLQTRPSTLVRVAAGFGLVAAGAAVGAVVTALVTPSTGPELRKRFARSTFAPVAEPVTAATNDTRSSADLSSSHAKGRSHGLSHHAPRS